MNFLCSMKKCEEERGSKTDDDRGYREDGSQSRIADDRAHHDQSETTERGEEAGCDRVR